MTKYTKKPDGVFLDAKTGRLYEHSGYSRSIHWSKQMLDDLKRMYATTKNEELAEMWGMGKSTVRRKARKLGLEKDKEWMKNVVHERLRIMNAMNKTYGNSGQIRKGEHKSPDTEYKKGHTVGRTSESIRKQSESMKIIWMRKKYRREYGRL